MGVYRVIYDKESNRIFEGEFEGDVREGKGTLYYHSGKIKYLGEWKNDLPDGLGVLFYENGNKFYEGEWKNGSASGNGVLFAEDGRREYEGQFIESKKNGIGTSYYIDGSTYKGEWKNDIKEGIGQSYYLNGNLEYDGFWMNNKRHGRGILYEKDGTILFEGIFENGEKLVRQEKEHIDKNLLKNIGIDIGVYDSNGRNIEDEGTNARFFCEDLEEEIQENTIDYQKEILEYESSDELENIEILSEFEAKDKRVKNINEEEIYGEEYVEEDIEKELDSPKYNKEEANNEDYNEREDIEEEIDDEEYNEKDEIEEEIDDEEYNEEEEIEKEIDGEEEQENKEEEKKDDNSVEVRIEDDKVYKYIEIEDIIYKGKFDENNRTGQGKVYYRGILKYEGFIKNGVYEGEGKLYDLDGKVEFEGVFKAGKRFGYGISYDSIGNPIYKGQWKNDFQDGEGELLNSNGDTIYKGMFYKGKALGLGTAVENEIENILYRELEVMIGLEEVKDDIARLVSFLKMQILRQRVSYKPMNIPYIFTFEGNIGVGKENVARILGKIYYTLGLIPEYNFIQRDLLTALEYTHDGEIEKTMDNLGGGVLYLSNLYQSNYEDITEIVKMKGLIDNILDLIEYSNGHFIIIFSGEEELIETMIQNKKELARCVGKSITFFDYSVEEMIDYVVNLSEEKDYILSDDLILELESFFTELLENEKYNNRNGEFIQEIFTELVKEQCIRIDTYGLVDIENLKVLELQDFKNIENKICF